MAQCTLQYEKNLWNLQRFSGASKSLFFHSDVHGWMHLCICIINCSSVGTKAFGGKT